MNRKALVFLLIGLIIIAIAPYLYVKFNWFDIPYNDTGEIGDTIGGLTAPFINLIGAVLVYMSFMEQKRANEIQISELEKDRHKSDEQNLFLSLEKEFLGVKKDIQDIVIVQYIGREPNRRTERKEGRRAIAEHFLVLSEKQDEEFLHLMSHSEIEYHLRRLNNLCFYVKNASIGQEEKRILSLKIKDYYDSMIHPIVEVHLDNMKNYHGFYNFLFSLETNFGMKEL